MTRPLWTLAEVIAAAAGYLDLPPQMTVSADARAHPERHVNGISIDTRTLALGDLFVPLADARDGHDFVTSAFERGAVAALVRESYARKPGDGALIRVDDPLQALGRVGMAARARLAPSARVIAVTGSAGKTGTKEMLRACLKICAASPDRVHAPEKSFNNHWGVPLTLARMPADSEFAVFEIGMNHAGEIRPLVKMVRPHVAIVTNVLPVHVGNFPDGEIGVANAKAEIFEGVEAPPATAFCSLSPSGEGSGVGGHNDLGAGGFTPPLTPPRQGEGDQPEQGERPVPCAVVLRDSPHFDLLRNAAGKHKARIITFGLHSDADVSLPNAPGEQANGSQYVIAVSRRTGKRIGFDLGMLGQHLAINSLAVVAAMEALGCDVGAATSALATVRSAAGRGARTALPAAGGNILLLDESYNANPASMAAALANLAATDNGGRRIAVMGDMLELAPPDQKHIAARYHKDLVTDLEPIDRVLCCGPLMRELYDLLPREKQAGWAEKSVELIDYVLAALRPGDVVMVKGSLGSRMAPIVDAIKKRFAGA